ncbi:MAG: hypothetical protein R2800_03355 [Flavipsychrobacter sp.]
MSYSIETKEMLSKTPNKFLIWGNISILLVLFVFFLVTNVISYGEKVTFPVIISAYPKISKYKPHAGSKLKQILFSNCDHIDSGELVAIFCDDFTYENIVYVKKCLDSFRWKTMHEKVSISDSLYFLDSLEGKSELFFNLKKLVFLLKRYSNISKRDNYQLKDKTEETIIRINMGIISWEKKNLYRAPYSGRIVFFNPINDNNQGRESEIMLGVIPDKYYYISRIEVPNQLFKSASFGKVINIELDEYDASEYGFITGEVVMVDSMLYDSSSLNHKSIFVKIPKDFSLKKSEISFPYQSKFVGSISISTADVSIFERVWNSVVHN